MSFDNDQFEEALSPLDEALQDDGRTPLALAAGLAAALAAGAIWAGLVFLTNMEVGYVAWGIGLLVGVAMSRITVLRSRQLAYAAGAFAVLGLLAGKAFIFAGSAGMIADELVANQETMTGTVAWQLYRARELDESTLSAIDALEASGDPVSDALWAQMTTQSSARLGTMSPEERHAAALVASKGVLQNMGMVAGIRSQLTAFDLLWLFLAVGTAFRMMAPPKEQPAAEPAVPV